MPAIARNKCINRKALSLMLSFQCPLAPCSNGVISCQKSSCLMCALFCRYASYQDLEEMMCSSRYRGGSFHVESVGVEIRPRIGPPDSDSSATEQWANTGKSKSNNTRNISSSKSRKKCDKGPTLVVDYYCLGF